MFFLRFGYFALLFLLIFFAFPPFKVFAPLTACLFAPLRFIFEGMFDMRKRGKKSKEHICPFYYIRIIPCEIASHTLCRACVGRSVLPPNGRSGLRLRGLLRARLPLFRKRMNCLQQRKKMHNGDIRVTYVC